MQRKVFRVEQMFAGRRAIGEPFRATPIRKAAPPAEEAVNASIPSLERELADLRDFVERNKRELTALIGDGKERPLARAADELRASVDGMDIATQKILKSAEVADDSAKALTASLKSDFDRGMALDIQDHVVQIYEACNFQDLAGQRISNVIGVLTMIEDRVSVILGRCDSAGAPARISSSSSRSLLNGPKLDGDTGHATQIDIDAMFA